MTAPDKTWPDGRIRCHWANPKNEKYIQIICNDIYLNVSEA